MPLNRALATAPDVTRTYPNSNGRLYPTPSRATMAMVAPPMTSVAGGIVRDCQKSATTLRNARQIHAPREHVPTRCSQSCA